MAKKAAKKRTSKAGKNASSKKASAKKASSKKASAKKGKAEASASASPRFPRQIYAVASTQSIGGQSMLETGSAIQANEVAAFDSEPGVTEMAVQRLQAAGLQVLQANRLMVNICGSRTAYERAFGTKLVLEQHETMKSFGRTDVAEFIECPTTSVPGLIPTAGTEFADVLEGIAIEQPRYLMAANPHPPVVDYWHLDVPGDVSLGCNADLAHRAGITGRGVKVAMVDSGWFRHPYFTGRGYRADDAILGPGTANPLADENGHGTGESANMFAVAPDATLAPVKAQLAGSLNDVLVNATGAFNQAVALNPQIITNSWGFSRQFGPLSAAEQALSASVAAAVVAGIVVVFSAGNGHFGFPGQHPDVISAGGVFMDADGSLEASTYSSGFDSSIFPGRRVPDVSGLVGMSPGAQYIMLPVAEGSSLDTGLDGGNHPNGDETAPDDGWAAFSGTSAAAPMVAGAAALLLEACPTLTPEEVRSILMSTAVDVTDGVNAHGNAATVGPDTATGDGLIDAHKAVLIAKLRCRVTPPADEPCTTSPPGGPGSGGVGPGGVVEPEVGLLGTHSQGVGLTREDVHFLEQMVLDGDDPFQT